MSVECAHFSRNLYNARQSEREGEPPGEPPVSGLARQEARPPGNCPDVSDYGFADGTGVTASAGASTAAGAEMSGSRLDVFFSTLLKSTSLPQSGQCFHSFAVSDGRLVPSTGQ